MKQKQARKKNCKAKACGKKFQPGNTTQVVCCWQCANAYAKEKREKEERKQLRADKAALKTRSEHLKEAQTTFNAYIRKRDQKLSCISCGRFHNGQIHAGHYRSVGAAPELRFEEDNVHAQCAPCNNHLSGNPIPYRQNLILKIGLDRVEWIEGKHDPKKYTIDQIKEIRRVYKEKLYNLKTCDNI